MENLTFDIHHIPRYDSTYATLFRIYTKENLYLLNALQQKNFNVDAMVKEKKQIDLKQVQNTKNLSCS
jgi:hypothetical protein